MEAVLCLKSEWPVGFVVRSAGMLMKENPVQSWSRNLFVLKVTKCMLSPPLLFLLCSLNSCLYRTWHKLERDLVSWLAPDQEFIHLSCGTPNAFLFFPHPSLRRIKNDGERWGENSIYPLKLPSCFSYFCFERLFYFPVDVYQSWRRLGSNPTLRLCAGTAVSRMPAVFSHLALLSFPVSLYICLRLPSKSLTPACLQRALISAGQEMKLHCPVTPSRREGTWGGKEEEVHEAKGVQN